jgi:hypothetical protein
MLNSFPMGVSPPVEAGPGYLFIRLQALRALAGIHANPLRNRRVTKSPTWWLGFSYFCK